MTTTEPNGNIHSGATGRYETKAATEAVDVGLAAPAIEPFDLDLWEAGEDADADDCALAEVTVLRDQIAKLGLVSESSRHVDLSNWVPGDNVDEDDGVAVEIAALREQLAERAVGAPVTEAEIAWAEKLTGTYDADSAPGYYQLMSRIFEQARAATPKPLTGNAAHVAAIGNEAGFHPSEGVMPAILNAILERGDEDVSWSVGKLTADDLGDLYDGHVGPLLDRLERHIGEFADERTGASLLMPHLELVAGQTPGDFDVTAATHELIDTYGRAEDVPQEEILPALQRHFRS